MYTLEDKQQVLTLSNTGWSVADIADETGISRATVYRILNEFENEDETETLDTNSNTWFHADGADNTYSQEGEYALKDFEIEDDDEDVVSQNDDRAFSNLSQNYAESPENAFEMPPHPPSLPSADPEVEKLRLQLAHEQEMEKLRQQADLRNIERENIALKARKLALQEAEQKRADKTYQQQLLKQAKQEQQTNQALLRRIQQAVSKLLKVSNQEKLTQAALEQLEEDWQELSEDIALRAEVLEEDYQDWLVGQAVQIVLENLETAYHEIESSFWNTMTLLTWDDEQIALLKSAGQAYALNQRA